MQAGQARRTGSTAGQPCPDESPNARERAARGALDLGTGQRLSDGEWVAARSRLLDLAVILRGWVRKAEKRDPELGNVDAICQREP